VVEIQTVRNSNQRHAKIKVENPIVSPFPCNAPHTNTQTHPLYQNSFLFFAKWPLSCCSSRSSRADKAAEIDSADMLSGVIAFLRVQFLSLSGEEYGSGANEVVTLAIVAWVVEVERRGRRIGDILYGGFACIVYVWLFLELDICREKCLRIDVNLWHFFV
jgi:hypothetical protein